ncbi:MAG: response regulator, partial [Vallitaleaceae bacterium]|nr:response regulator [Vallitaleaceae bacterium]
MFRLLIADDEPIVQEGIKFMVEDLFDDVEVVGVASSGREAIELAMQSSPDIIFMDIKMPGINGIEAIETIKRRNPYVKFVIISAYEQFEYAK